MPGHTPDIHQYILNDIGIIEHHWHSRWRVYPQDVTESKTLTAGTPANTFGAWVLIVPYNTVPFDFEVVGMVIEQVDAVTIYHIQIGYDPLNAEPGSNMELGERRVRIDVKPIVRATELLSIHGQDVPTKSSVWGRIKTASGNADTAQISVILYRHIEVTKGVPIYPAFPW